MQAGPGSCPFSHTLPCTPVPCELTKTSRGKEIMAPPTEANRSWLTRRPLIISAAVNYTNYGVNWQHYKGWSYIMKIEHTHRQSEFSKCNYRVTLLANSILWGIKRDKHIAKLTSSSRVGGPGTGQWLTTAIRLAELFGGALRSSGHPLKRSF